MTNTDSPAELETQIRFALDSLGQSNGHHAFEQICLGIARRRITSNLMPATGPVSAGGDQARDAESYWSNLASELPGTSVFTALVSDELVVMGCSIQQTDVVGKIRHDVASLGAQAGVARLIYFITAPLAVAKRHTLQDEALRDHHIKLEIFDRFAISSELKEHDLYYLAVAHMQLPASLAPDPPAAESALPAWYVDDRQRWRDRSTPGSTLGDLVDLSRPLRHAIYHAETRADLPDWVAAVRTLVAQSPGEDVVARARYELIVAAMSGMGDLRVEDETMRDYFRDLPMVLPDLGILEDAVLMLEFGAAAWFRAVTSITRSELDGWRSDLRARVAELLDAEPYPNAEASLLAAAARLALQPRYPDDMDPREAEPASIVELAEVVRAAVEAGESPQVPLDPDLDFVDLDGGMRALQQLVRRLPEAPFFPIKNTVDHFGILVPVLVDHPLYIEVRDGLDAAVERVEGAAACGDRAQDRGLALFGAGRLLSALREVHEAKINWWHGDTVEGAAIMCLLASRIYSELGLPIAAKQYALTAATIAQGATSPDHKILAARGIVLAASYEHQAGMWLSATQTFRIGLLAQHAYSDDPMNEDHYEYVTHMLVDQAHIVRAARTVRPDYLQVVNDAIDKLSGLGDVLDTMLQTVEHLPALAEAEYAEIADRDGLGRPFSDAGPIRRYSWAALGTVWEVTCANERDAVLATERFVSTLQITLAELAAHDALLLSGSVRVEVRPDRSALAVGTEQFEELPDNSGTRWLLHLTQGSDLSDTTAHVEAVSAVVVVLMDRSLLAPSAFMALIESAFETGLWHKVLSARPYDEIAALLDADMYVAMASLMTPAPGSQVELAPHHASDALAPLTTPAPGYNPTESTAAISARYANMVPLVRRTVGLLVDDSVFQATLKCLRADGWLDWHVLTAVANLAGNERARRSGIQLTTTMTAEDREAALEIMQQPETESSVPLPTSLFSEEALRSHLNGAVLSTLATLGLSNNQRTPDFAAIFNFLGDRYSYWQDDVPHDPLFDIGRS